MFDDFLKELAKPSWWIGVVVVGFLINLASAYAKPLIDKTLGEFWLSSKEAAERKESLIIERARRLLESPLLVVELKLDILKHTLRAIFLTASAIICFLFIVLGQNKSLAPIMAFPFNAESLETIGNTALLIIGGIQLILSTLIFTKSFDGDRILHAYGKLKKEGESGGARS